MNPGDQLFNRYRIERLIGSSGLTLTYEARDEELNRAVVIKELLPEHASDPSSRARFVFGSQALVGLALPNVVTVHDVLRSSETAYLVLEYLPGGSLADRLRREKRLSLEAALAITFNLCQALETAHARGMVHRNIAPQSIVFDVSGEARLTGFGLADVPRGTIEHGFALPLTLAEDTRMQRLVYTAPEQILKTKIDGRCDLYSLGAILYAMVTGAPHLNVSKCSSMDEAMQVILLQRPQPPSRLNPEIAPWLDSIILKALEKRPQHRFEDINEMQAALQSQTIVPLNTNRSSWEGDIGEVASRRGWKTVVEAGRESRSSAGRRHLRVLRNMLKGSLGGAVGGLLIGGLAYAARAALVGLPQVLEEGAVPAILGSVLVTSLIGALLGWAADSGSR